MAAIDKAAIVWTIAIVIAGAGVAGMGDSLQGIGSSNTVSNTAPTTNTESMEKTSTDPFADISSKVQEQAAEREVAIQEQMQMAKTSEEESMMEDESMKMMEDESMMMEMMEEPATAATTEPQIVVVTVPAGTSVPGCEETNECYLPPSVSINTGDTVSWDNVDTAAHTVTSGTPADGPDGIFDSSLLMGGASFEVTFDESGSYDYFCMVHPWMIGDVQVS